MNDIAQYYAANADRMRLYALKAMGNYADAEDAVQDCFVQLLRIGHDIIPASLHALAYKILRNIIYGRMRWIRIKREAESYIGYTVERMGSIEPNIHANDLARHLEIGISTMPEKYQTIYRLSVEEDKKVAEIAYLLGNDYKNTEYCLGKARQIMRKYVRALALAE